jgi:hypothetical protein
MLSLLPSVNFESFEPALDQPFPSESARVIFASDGAHLCALLCMVRAYIKDGRKTLGLGSSIVTVIQPPESIEESARPCVAQ